MLLNPRAGTRRLAHGTLSACEPEPLGHTSYLVELHDVGSVLLLIDLLLSLEQCVLAVRTAANPVVVLLIQDGADTAHAADAAPAGAVDAIRGLAGAGVGAQGFLAGTGELVWKAQEGKAAVRPNLRGTGERQEQALLASKKHPHLSSCVAMDPR